MKRPELVTVRWTIEDIVLCDESKDSPIRRKPITGTVDVEIDYHLYEEEASTREHPGTPQMAEEAGYRVDGTDLQYYWGQKLSAAEVDLIQGKIDVAVEAWIDNNAEWLEEEAFSEAITEEDLY